MSPVTELQFEFLHRLRRLRRKMAIRQFGVAVITVLPYAVAAGICCWWADSMSRRAVAGAFLLCLASGTVALFWRRFPRLKTCARCLDTVHAANSRVVNALEVIEANRNSSFAFWTIREGLGVLCRFPAELPRETRRGVRWIISYGGMLLAVATVFWASVFRLSTASPTAENTCAVTSIAAGGNDSQPELRRSDVVRNLPRVPMLHSASQPDTGNEAHRQSGNRNVFGNADAGRMAMVPGRDLPDAPVEGTASTEFRTTATANAAPASEEAGSWENSLPGTDGMQLTTATAGDTMQESRRSRRPRRTRRHPESALGGALPLLPDHAPPAGRELAEKEGEGEEPDSGRGGPTGEKKSRGTASMLPVTPLPDLVNGRMGPGEELTVPERSPLREAGKFDTPPLAVLNHPEPVCPEPTLPLAIRRLQNQENE